MMKEVDECAGDPLLCQGGTCVNTEGSYECHCPSGHELKDDCVNIDECTMSESLCPDGQCINVIGAFRCSCHTGFQSTPDGQGCVGETIPSLGCSLDYEVQYTNTEGNVQCSCWQGAQYKSMHSIVDVDECEDNLGICGEGQCTNMPGSYHCMCYDGFSASPDMKICVDLNECDMNPYLCLHGNCENTKGSFTCHCHLGYVIREGATGCSDVDECEFRRHSCDRHASCVNIPGSFSCRCHPGWGGDGFKCHDLDECAIQQHRCDPNANCLNTVGSYHCTCQPGFVGDGLFCEDKDECMENMGLCENGQCLNVPGGYHCECDMGFNLTKNQLACWGKSQPGPVQLSGHLCLQKAQGDKEAKPGSHKACPCQFKGQPSLQSCFLQILFILNPSLSQSANMESSSMPCARD
uniref:EGF-like domain-containing protein n=1 Tax=Peromyscus maniculatus bairdii TaxID=230844 RepID=A0A8C8UHI6_PERMB